MRRKTLFERMSEIARAAGPALADMAPPAPPSMIEAQRPPHRWRIVGMIGRAGMAGREAITITVVAPDAAEARRRAGERGIEVARCQDLGPK